MMPRPSTLPTEGPAFALISVLALVSLAALTATAFLASARLEKIASMSTGDQTRLTLALDSGYHLGSYVYTRGDNTWNWVDFLMKEDGDGVGYLFHAVPYSGANKANIGQWYNYATFSCATLSNIGVTPLDPTNWSATTTWQGGFASNLLVSTSRFSRMMNFTDTNVTPNGPVTRIPLLFGRTSPVVSWITNYVTNPSTKLLSPTFRFAFFTEDPSGLIDAERMGGSTTRNTGTNPNEFALGEIGLTNMPTFTTLRQLFLNPGMIEEVIRSNNVTNGSVTNPWRYLSSSLYSVNGWLSTSSSQRQGYQRIPAGLGYAEADSANNADQPAKRNLNEFFANGTASSSAMTEIVKAITNNLPSFAALRSGAMNTNAYISNIAANIVDYVDADSTPTVDPNIASAATNANTNTWRGVENIAYPNEVFTRFNLTDRQTNPPNYLFKLNVKHYIELWNLSSASVVVNGSDYSIFDNLDIPLKCTNWPGNLKSADSANLPGSETCTAANFTLPPNSYGVIATGTRTFNILVPTNLATNANPSLTINPSTTANKYTISYKGKIIDATPGGRYLGSSTNMKVGDFHFITTAVNFGTSVNGNQFNLSSGDPRGGLFVQLPAKDFAYKYTTPGGRNADNNPSTIGGAKYVDPKVNWPDGGHSLGNSGADIATPPTSANNNNSIAQGLTKQGNANHWVQKANDSGNFTNILELGNIFDPIQWGDPNNPFHPYDSSSWMGLSNSATSFNGACGRTTLRLGRAEHQRFAWTKVSGQVQPNMQASAASLLDIFCATTNNPSFLSGRFDEGNQVNINTAPPKVLRALAAGVILTSDAAMKPTPPYPIPKTAIDAFVKGVTNFRAKYPFYSASQLAFIGTDPQWPNTNTWPANAVFSPSTYGVSECNDVAAEEWFSKIYALSKVYTRNYRIYVQAQLIKTRGTNTNANSLVFGAIGRRYYDVLNQQNNTATNTNPSCSVYLLRKVDY